MANWTQEFHPQLLVVDFLIHKIDSLLLTFYHSSFARFFIRLLILCSRRRPNSHELPLKLNFSLISTTSTSSLFPLFCEVVSSFERQSITTIWFKLYIRRYRDGCLLPSLLHLCIFNLSSPSPSFRHLLRSLSIWLGNNYKLVGQLHLCVAGEQCFQLCSYSLHIYHLLGFFIHLFPAQLFCWLQQQPMEIVAWVQLWL